ncbi:hypothetical protein DIPPA_25525 [Diplonema papillatum]|nr:hypothetical protein DIPPA_25525 [Diplonema papillatum]|eukprot:gene19726-30399_t
MSLSIKLIALCLVATSFVRAQDDEAPADFDEEIIYDFNLRVNFSVGVNDVFTSAVVNGLGDGLIKVKGVVSITFITACEAGLCVTAADLAAPSETRPAAALQAAARFWDFTFRMRANQTREQVDVAVAGSAAALALAVSPNAELVAVVTSDATPVGGAEDDDDDLSDSAIAAIVIGCVLCVAIVVAAAFLVKSRGGSSAPDNTAEPTNQPHEA